MEGWTAHTALRHSCGQDEGGRCVAAYLRKKKLSANLLHKVVKHEETLEMT